VDILDTYLDGLGTLQPSLEKVLLDPRRDVRVRVLLACPGGHLASARGVYREDEVSKNARACIDRLEGFRRQLDSQRLGTGSRVEYGFFDVTVQGPLYLVDRTRVFAGSFLQLKGSQHTPMYELRSSWMRRWLGDLTKAYIETFDACWGRRAPACHQ